MQAIHAKTIEDIKEYLDTVGAEMEIISFNIRELNMQEEQKRKNVMLISKLRQDVYNTAKQLKSGPTTRDELLNNLLDCFSERN